MRRKAVEMLVLTLLLAGTSIGMGQQKDKDKAAPGKSKLEEMLAEALRNNPDIRVAAAKMAEAEAELNRTRLQVTQKIVATYHAIETQKKIIAHAEAKFKRANELTGRLGKLMSQDEYEDIKQTLTLAKAKLDDLEAQLPALLGKMTSAADTNEGVAMRRVYEFIRKQPDASNDSEAIRRGLEWIRRQQSPPDTATQFAIKALQAAGQAKPVGQLTDKLRRALQTPVKANFDKLPFSAVLEDLAKKAPGLSIRCTPRVQIGPVMLHFEEELPVSAVLQALEDDFDIRFVVREYGILVTPRNMAPPGAMTVQELLRQKPPEKKKNPPAENIEGKIKEVDPKANMVLLSIGSDAGLLRGQTLEVFRLADKAAESKYLGTLRIVEVKAKESVAQPVGRLTDTPQVGDRVSSRLLGK